jgi:hypothetical protein
MSWDHKYRQLDEGELILATDGIQHDDGSWHPPHPRTVGTPAPSPLYTARRVYRRAQQARADDGRRG